MQNKIAKNIKEILVNLGEDPYRIGLIKTPDRVEKSLIFLTSGYSTEKEILKDCKEAIFAENVHSIVSIKNIEFYSLCEHHLLPFYGNISISFLPNKNGNILGLSKFARIVDLFSHRLQVQERLVQDICESLWRLLKPQGIAIRIEARHMCMIMRGVQKQQSSTKTYYYKGQKNLEEKIKYELT